MTIYLIPGLATDERLFHRTVLPGLDIRVLSWPVFDPADDMTRYAGKFLPQIETSEPFLLLGVSFGGMCAVEISKIISPEKLILVSSAKGSDELPAFIKMFRYFPLHRILPQIALIKMSEAVKHIFGRHHSNDRELLLAMLRECPDNYLNGAVHCIVTWASHSAELKDIEIVHIHGNSDRVIPFRNIKNAIKLEGGNHFMILNQARKVNEILKNHLGL